MPQMKRTISLPNGKIIILIAVVIFYSYIGIDFHNAEK
ncbi:hypothetical protein BTJ44_03373 [Bacillus mycoides]|nr:hypothetical protein BTJ44_03373 [Bacillus mycoides]